MPAHFHRSKSIRAASCLAYILTLLAVLVGSSAIRAAAYAPVSPEEDPFSLVKDIRPGNVGSFPEEFTVIGNTLYFSADDDIHMNGLWKTDGTEPGTVRISSDDVTGVKALVAAGSTLFFTAYDVAHGQELWKSDGTPAGTGMVKDIFPGTDSAFDDTLNSIVAMNGAVYFVADDGAHGCELWKSNGSAEGTVVVKDIVAGAEDGLDCTGSELVVMNNTLYFIAQDSNLVDNVWKSDGTGPGTQMLKEISTDWAYDPSELTPVNGTLFFLMQSELWKSDGTADGTELVKSFGGPNFPGFLTAAGDTLFFLAGEDDLGLELWKSDGSPAGTQRVKDINPGSESAFFSIAATLYNGDGTLYFAADDGTHGFELWKSDGTPAGTVMVKDINPGGSSEPDRMYAANGSLYFKANNGVDGRELWQSDGTPEETFMAANVCQVGPSDPFSMIWMSGTLYFSATDCLLGKELYKLNSTTPAPTPTATATVTTTPSADGEKLFIPVVSR